LVRLLHAPLELVQVNLRPGLAALRVLLELLLCLRRLPLGLLEWLREGVDCVVGCIGSGLDCKEVDRRQDPDGDQQPDQTQPDVAQEVDRGTLSAVDTAAQIAQIDF
jgi:hypothetical protein